MFLDESGFLLQPLRRDTWAPVGLTPVRYAWDRHDRLSAICALTVAPWAWRVGLYYNLLNHNVHADDVMQFIRSVHQHQRRPMLLIWDRWQVHRSAAKRLSAEGSDWLHVAWLPAYAPELDPVEFVWNHAKYVDLANWIPADIADVKCHLQKLLERYRHDPCCLHSFFQAADLT
jgi:transposase